MNAFELGLKLVDKLRGLRDAEKFGPGVTYTAGKKQFVDKSLVYWFHENARFYLMKNGSDVAYLELNVFERICRLGLLTNDGYESVSSTKGSPDHHTWVATNLGWLKAHGAAWFPVALKGDKAGECRMGASFGVVCGFCSRWTDLKDIQVDHQFPKAEATDVKGLAMCRWFRALGMTIAEGSGRKAVWAKDLQKDAATIMNDLEKYVCRIDDGTGKVFYKTYAPNTRKVRGLTPVDEDGRKGRIATALKFEKDSSAKKKGTAEDKMKTEPPQTFDFGEVIMPAEALTSAVRIGGGGWFKAKINKYSAGFSAEDKQKQSERYTLNDLGIIVATVLGFLDNGFPGELMVNNMFNLAPLCGRCNGNKSNAWIKSFGGLGVFEGERRQSDRIKAAKKNAWDDR